MAGAAKDSPFMTPEIRNQLEKQEHDVARDRTLSGEEMVQEENAYFKAAVDGVIIKVQKKNDYEGNWITYLEARKRGSDKTTQSKMTVAFSAGHWEVKDCSCQIPYDKSARMQRMDAVSHMRVDSPVEVRIVP